MTPAIGDSPEINRRDGAAILEVAGAAIGEGVIGTAGIFWAGVARMFQFLEIVAGSGLEEVHIVVCRGGFFFTEENRLRGIRNVAFQHGGAGHFAEVPGRSQLLLKEIVPSIDDVAAVG